MVRTIFYMHQNRGACAEMYTRNLTHQMKKTATESQRKRNALTCCNEKVQINNVEMKTFSFHPFACLPLL